MPIVENWGTTLAFGVDNAVRALRSAHREDMEVMTRAYNPVVIPWWGGLNANEGVVFDVHFNILCIEKAAAHFGLMIDLSEFN